MVVKSVRRQQRDIDKTRQRLYNWSAGSPSRNNDVALTVNQLLDDVANFTGHQSSDVRATFAQEPYVTAVRIAAMCLWLKGDDGTNASSSPLSDYIKERGRRESSVGRRWLHQLAQSQYELREVVHVTPNVSARLSPTATGGTTVTVHEPRLAISQTLGLFLFGLVLPMPAGSVVADGLLILSQDDVATLPNHPKPSDVFVRWAATVLAAEGVAATARPQIAPGSSDSSAPEIEPPNDDTSSRGNTREQSSDSSAERSTSPDAESREKLLARVRKLFAMAQETEASPHEAEIALRRCQSLMAKFGITEKDLETSEFGHKTAYAGKRVPAHIKFLSVAVAKLNGVLFVSGGGGPAHFRGYEIDVHVARLTLDYLSDAVERALTTRRRTGEFPAGRMAAYDYRLAFAEEVIQRVYSIVSERQAYERSNSPTGTALTIRKLEIVKRECGKDLSTSTLRARGAIDEEAAGAGREDGSRVSLDPQVASGRAPLLLGSD